MSQDIKSMLTYNYKIIKMKSKINSNSNIEEKKVKKKSLLVTKGKEKNLFHFSHSLHPSSREINLAGSQINSLEGIEIFKNLEVVYLNNNQLFNIESFSSLKKCEKLKRIQIHDNPICGKINIQYELLMEVGRIIQIDDIKIEARIEQIKSWQISNGANICLFLLQSCSVFQQMSQKEEENQIMLNKSNLLAQLQRNRELLRKLNHRNKSQFILQINEIIRENFPLESLPVPYHNFDQIDEVKDYLIDKIIENSQISENHFLFKLLSLVEVTSDNEQKELLQNTEVTKLILHGMIERIFQSSIESDKLNKFDVKHLTSADTALQTIDTGGRTLNKNSYLKSFHFCMDFQYLNQLNKVMLRELERVIYILQGEQKNAEILEESFEDSLNQVSIEIIQPYKNGIILEEMIQSLEIIIKKIAFRRIKRGKKKLIDQKQVIGISLCLAKLTQNRLQLFAYIKNNYFKQIGICKKMDTWRLSQIFSAWKNLKKKKMKMLKKIVKRKIKNDNFLVAITLAKWKINSRAEKIFKMANAIMTISSELPKSKKGVDIAYRRAIATKNLSLQN